MVRLHVLFASLCLVGAFRVNEDFEEEVDTGVRVNEDFEEAVDAGALADSNTSMSTSTAWVKPKLVVVDVAVADKRFRSTEEPVLLPGEVVEKAFFDKYRDWLLFTNWRTIRVDGDATVQSGYGKTAVPNKITYTSNLWEVYSGAQTVTVTTAGNSRTDKDVEVSFNPGVGMFELSKDVGDEVLFEFGEYLRGKLRAPMKRLFSIHVTMPDPADKANGVYSWQSNMLYKQRKGTAVLYFDTRSESWKLSTGGSQSAYDYEIDTARRGAGREIDGQSTFLSKDGGLSCEAKGVVVDPVTIVFLDKSIPGMGVLKESDKSVDEILGPARNMIDAGETVFYKLTETYNILGIYDDMIITDRQVIFVNQKLRGKKQYSNVRLPVGLDPWAYINHWEIETAGRYGRERSCEITAKFKILGRTFHFKLDKNAVKTPDLFAYHTKLQRKIAAAYDLK